MSWFLIILLVLMFFVFTLSCVVLIAWIYAGSPAISASNTLDFQSGLQEPAATNASSINLSDGPMTLAGVTGLRVLVAANTGGFIVATGAKAAAPADPNDNRLVQTLYIGGKPAVTRTTTFGQPSVVGGNGPVELTSEAAQQEVVQWYNDNRNINLQQLMKKGTTLAAEDSDAPSAPADVVEHRRQQYVEMRQKSLLPAISEHAQRKSAAEAGLRDPHEFHLSLRQEARQACASSSTMQLPVQLFVPQEYSTSPAAVNGRQVRWIMQQITASPTGGSEPALQQTLLWQSHLIPLANLIIESQNGTLEVHTHLQCSSIANALMRIKLVDSTGRDLCSAFFNPTSLISNAPTSFASDMRTAWNTYRQISRAPHP